jgi:uncharacterized repeat protein (TIGR04042 family)
MPEMLFHIVWPDGTREACYSPSLVVKEHFEAGQSYEIPEFLARGRAALTIASERVRARYGFACSRALGQLDRLERNATRFENTPLAAVSVERFEDL